MLAIESWAIYYADGSTFTSEDGTWAEAPPFGVQAVVYYHVPPYKTIDGGHNSGDIYTFQGGDAHPDYEGVKMGLWVDRDTYYRIQDLALRSTSPVGD